MSAFRRYILLALLTGFSGPGFPTAARAAGTAPDAPDFNFTHYNSGNSELPYDRVNKIVQDSQGFIWCNGTAQSAFVMPCITFWEPIRTNTLMKP